MVCVVVCCGVVCGLMVCAVLYVALNWGGEIILPNTCRKEKDVAILQSWVTLNSIA